MRVSRRKLIEGVAAAWDRRSRGGAGGTLVLQGGTGGAGGAGLGAGPTGSIMIFGGTGGSAIPNLNPSSAHTIPVNAVAPPPVRVTTSQFTDLMREFAVGRDASFEWAVVHASDGDLDRALHRAWESCPCPALMAAALCAVAHPSWYRAAQTTITRLSRTELCDAVCTRLLSEWLDSPGYDLVRADMVRALVPDLEFEA